MSPNPWDVYTPSYFHEEEFRGWARLLDPVLLVRLDAFRGAWGKPVTISPVDGAIGREDDSGSQHNFSRWKMVRAVDVLPGGIKTQWDLERAQKVAIGAGFTGVGVYPHWRPTPGLHLDVRRSNAPGAPALWGGIRPDRDQPQQLVSAEAALAAFTEAPA
ncbi:MAG: hypothetical protein V2I24_09315 [Halieaceae bacterium]|jgi:hypothetical protein|nr:hypothetical protein [Halieaceae bacterium]